MHKMCISFYGPRTQHNTHRLQTITVCTVLGRHHMPHTYPDKAVRFCNTSENITCWGPFTPLASSVRFSSVLSQQCKGTFTL